MDSSIRMADTMVSTGRRVLMVLENNPYPFDVRVAQEAKTLTQAGYQVSIISPARRGQPARELVDGVRAYRYPVPAGGFPWGGHVAEFAYATVVSFLLSIVVWV